MPDVVREQNAHLSAPTTVEIESERQRWRERMLAGIAWSLFVVCVGTFVWYATVENTTPEMIVPLVASAATMLVIIFARRLPLLVRTVLLLLFLYVPCAYGIRLAGFAPNAIMGLAMLVVSATLLLGRSAGLATVVVSTATVVVMAVLHRTGVIDRHPAWLQTLDSTIPVNTLRIGLVFALLTTTMVVGISYLLRRSEDLARETVSSLAQLKEEQLERERIAKELEFNEASFAKARELEVLGRLAGSMAHDFNNSLLVIWSSLEELQFLGPIPPKLEPVIASIRSAAQQAAATTRQLRAFGPTAPARPTDLELGPVVERAKAMLARVLPSNIELVATVEKNATVLGDEGELLRVLTNLALNARDAMREGGRVTLRVRDPRAEEPTRSKGGAPLVVIEVEDDGSGMTDEVKARLFEPFFTTKQESGTGLGLASVRDVVEARGGSVCVESALGKGTTISLFWPTATAATKGESERGVPQRAASAVVLVVDDDTDVREAISRGLTRAGMTVLQASDGASALLTARRHNGRIDVLCTDCVMPGVPVLQLIKSFREIHPGRVIVCSGYAPAETGLSPEVFDDFLPKPFTPETLATRVTALLAQPAPAQKP